MAKSMISFFLPGKGVPLRAIIQQTSLTIDEIASAKAVKYLFMAHPTKLGEMP